MEFNFALTDRVLALDYDKPRREHEAVVIGRWKEEDDHGMYQEHYEVLINGIKCEFLAADLRKL